MLFNNFWAYSRIICSTGFLKAIRDTHRNVLAAERGARPRNGPYMAELDVTYRCNCRCWYNNNGVIGHYGRLLEASGGVSQNDGRGQ